MVFALGTFFDISLPIYSVIGRANEFYEVALTALKAEVNEYGAFKLDTIPAVQTLHLMTLYLLSTKGETGGEPAWQLLGMAMRSIQAQGCHRDGSRWGLPLRESEERRRVFWETHIYDRLVRFIYGFLFFPLHTIHSTLSNLSHSVGRMHKAINTVRFIPTSLAVA
jgi:hypothetical protein